MANSINLLLFCKQNGCEIAKAQKLRRKISSLVTNKFRIIMDRSSKIPYLFFIQSSNDKNKYYFLYQRMALGLISQFNFYTRSIDKEFFENTSLYKTSCILIRTNILRSGVKFLIYGRRLFRK